MLMQFECPLCGEFNEICIVGGRERKGFKCHGCGSKLEITEGCENNILEVKESEEGSEDESEEDFYDLEEIQNAY